MTHTLRVQFRMRPGEDGHAYVSLDRIDGTLPCGLASKDIPTLLSEFSRILSENKEDYFHHESEASVN